ncbi:PAS domain-containing sensor histidine kinase [Limnofasciculus baicalensis]|uniref:histidine kinase n=1 Tax=Limnofasciculus baicalensis BBK-W-15 TaxID=2699891 RepID=A0AAE3GLP0_9CYAN|nr:PAS domain S-box protein [Limnofasciculus baicalensis]MCP2726896.1 PAS domain S-box protein [Limnofasciculus baicalensis BBK-W-15]
MSNQLTQIIESLKDRITHLHQQVSKIPQTPEQSEQIAQTFTEINALFSNANTPEEIAKHQEVKQLQAKLTAIVEATSDLVSIADVTRRILYLNRAGYQLLGIDPNEDITTHEISEFHTPETDNEIVNQGIPIAIKDGVWTGETTLRKCNGEIFPVSQVIIAHKSESGEVEYLSTIARDISNRKQIEEALHQSQFLIQQITDTTPQILYIHDLTTQGNIYVNRQIFEILGYLPEKPQQEGRRFFISTLHPHDLPTVLEHMNGFTNVADGEVREVEYRIKHANGTWRWLCNRDVVFSRTSDGLPKQILGTARDITQGKLIEMALWESESRLHTLVNSISDGVLLVDYQGIIRFVNAESLNLFGLSLEKLVDSEFGIPSLVGEMTELAVNHPTRGLVILEMRTAQTLWQGEYVYVVTLRDISDRKKADELIQASLREKEVLLKEIHHRVKNNLQIISSLLRLQANRIEDEGVRVILQESQSRVESMALVHESLYRSENFSQIDFTQYVENLAANLFRTYNVHLESNSFKLHVADGLFISLAQAVPCGLIINELISNALKHGFPNRSDGEVSLTLETSSNRHAILTVGNKGNTLPVDFDLQKTQSMGLKLVITLVKQLKGMIEIERGDITLFKIQFPLSEVQRNPVS